MLTKEEYCGGQQGEKTQHHSASGGGVAAVVLAGEDAALQLVVSELEHAALGVHVLQNAGPDHQGLAINC